MSSSTQNNQAMRITAVLAVVALGHLASGWVISKMKMPEIQRLEPIKPLEVKIVHIEKPKPKVTPPQPKKELPKEQPKPKPQPPKEVKKVVEKPKPQVTPPKPVPQRVVQTKTTSVKPQQTALDVPPAPPSPPVEKPVPPAPPVEKPTPPAPPVEKPMPPAPPVEQPTPSKPVSLSEGVLAWRSPPRINAQSLAVHIEKAKQDVVRVVVEFETNAKGKVISATVSQSSGVPSLDNYVKSRVLAASLKEYKQNGVAVPVKSRQSFDLEKPKKK